MFRYRDEAVVKKIGVIFILKVKAIFDALFLFNKSF